MHVLFAVYRVHFKNSRILSLFGGLSLKSLAMKTGPVDFGPVDSRSSELSEIMMRTTNHFSGVFPNGD